MGIFTYNIDDPHDKVEQIIEAVELAGRPDVAQSNRSAAKLRQHFWDTRRITSHGTYYGNPDLQWIARIPQALAELLDMRHPGWDSDEATMRKVLALYPKCKVLPEEARQ